MTSLPPCWWTETKDLSLASFVRPPGVVPFSIVIGVFRGWLKTSKLTSDGYFLAPEARRKQDRIKYTWSHYWMIGNMEV